MSKVGIMSMQRIANYGSFLQAYGLKSIFEELGCEVAFVDYHPGETLIPADGGTGIKRKINKVVQTFKYSAPLKEKFKFIKYKKNYARKYLPLLGIDESMNYSTDYDVLVIGSDEVFNCVQDNTNVGYASDLFGANSKASKLVSYAASFGNTTMDKMKQYGIDKEVGDWLTKFDNLSVRDENSAEVVKKITGIIPELNMDPVLMYDYINKCDKIPKIHTEKKYMILYGYSGRFSKDECKVIKKKAEKLGVEIYCIGGVQDACDVFLDCSPFEVISYFQNAEFVITDTFHGSILSVITHRPFATIVRTEGYGNMEKLTDLLKRLNLENRIINDITEMDSFISRKIDYESVDSIIQEQRVKTYDYLSKVID